MLNRWFDTFKNARVVWLASFCSLALSTLTLAAESPCTWSRVGGEGQPIRVGDTVTLRLSGCETATGVMAPESSNKDSVPEFILVNPDLNSNREAQFTLIKSGTVEIPSLNLVPDGKTESIALKVESVLTDEEKKQPIPAEPVMAAPIPWSSILIALLVFGILVAAIFYGLKKYLNRPKPALELAPIPEKPLLPEDLEILETLKAIEAENAIRKGNAKQWAYGCSDAWKRYIARRYQFDAEEKTTRELTQSLEMESIPVAIIKEFESLMRDLDQTKFTDLKPMEGEAILWPERIRAWVEKTKRRPVVP